MLRGTRLAASFAALGLFLAACDSTDSRVTDLDSEDLTGPDGGIVSLGVVGEADTDEFEVCKSYVGTPGPAVTIDYEFDYDSDGSADLTDAVVLADGECAEIFDALTDTPTGVSTLTVTVTEQVPAGYTASYIKTTKVLSQAPVSDPEAAGNSASGAFEGQDVDYLVEFINTEIIEPPGEEGCTPGYWRQEHHFDSYPAGLDPTTPFIGGGTGFSYDPALAEPESGYASDLDLLGALTLRGGGPNALIRHAAAAILNASSADVDYPYSAGEVQDLYNVDMDKEALEGANELGCPLN